MAVAWCASEYNQRTAKLHADMKEAEKTGDKKRVAEIKAYASILQDRLHRQGFGKAPVDDLLEDIRAKLPEVARQAGVEAIVSGVIVAGTSVERVDVTEALVEAFDPSDKTRKMVSGLKDHEPLEWDQFPLNEGGEQQAEAHGEGHEGDGETHAEDSRGAGEHADATEAASESNYLLNDLGGIALGPVLVPARFLGLITGMFREHATFFDKSATWADGGKIQIEAKIGYGVTVLPVVTAGSVPLCAITTVSSFGGHVAELFTLPFGEHLSFPRLHTMGIKK